MLNASMGAMCTYETLEGELANEQLGRLLVSTNLTKSDGTGLITMRLLDTTGRRRALTGYGVLLATRRKWYARR